MRKILLVSTTLCAFVGFITLVMGQYIIAGVCALVFLVIDSAIMMQMQHHHPEDDDVEISRRWGRLADVGDAGMEAD